MKIVLCNGDSLGMPRESVLFEDTWFFKLSNNLPKEKFYCINNFRRANTTNALASKDFLENYNPNIIIVQLGIVDCAPRIYNTNSIIIKIINRLPIFFKDFFWLISKKYKKRSQENAEVTLYKFKKNIEDFVERCKVLGVDRCIFIKIQIPGQVMIKKNPEIIESITQYNKVYDEFEALYSFVKVLNPLSEGNENWYIDDGYHVNKNGFQQVFDSLITEFQSC
ncbi:MAG: hypothetical protein NWQ14_09955 [Flavobacterium sp.]|jgi:hypothetical protein|nr:hypothetical protein [Flavobacterium sp.]